MRFETWVYEQALHGALVVLAAVVSYLHLAERGSVSTRDLALLSVAVCGQIVAQKQRSFASRQVEQDRRDGLVGSKLSCHRAQARWATIGQTFSVLVGVATAPTWAHIPLALWAAFYGPAWRRWRASKRNLGHAAVLALCFGFAACQRSEYGTHSLTASPLEVPGLNSAEHGWRPVRVNNPNYFGNKKDDDSPPPSKRWHCSVTTMCALGTAADPIKVPVTGEGWGESRKEALKLAVDDLIGQCAYRLGGRTTNLSNLKPDCGRL
jgi:hypothetical protein